MARSDARYSVYPAPKAIELLGNSAPALNTAIECWAALLARASADNADAFTPSYAEPVDGTHWKEHCLHDWGLLAIVLHGMKFDPDFAKPGELLATAVEDRHRLEKVARDWYDTEGDIIYKNVDSAVQTLCDSLRKLDYVHAWAIFGAVAWYWDHHHEGIDIKKDEWWTLAFRRAWKAGKITKPQSVAASDQQPPSRRRKPKKPESANRKSS
jgi:hypothetical protein